ncbi:hypothetical protein D3C86_2116580 [compost metagenome]
MRVRIVAHHLEVFELVVVDGCWLTKQLQLRQLTWRTCDLSLHLLHVVGIDMDIAERNYDLTNVEVALLGEHVRQARQGCRVVWEPQEAI